MLAGEADKTYVPNTRFEMLSSGGLQSSVVPLVGVGEFRANPDPL